MISQNLDQKLFVPSPLCRWNPNLPRCLPSHSSWLLAFTVTRVRLQNNSGAVSSLYRTILTGLDSFKFNSCFSFLRAWPLRWNSFSLRSNLCVNHRSHVVLFCLGAGMILSIEDSVAPSHRLRFRRLFVLTMILVTLLYVRDLNEFLHLWKNSKYWSSSPHSVVLVFPPETRPFHLLIHPCGPRNRCARPSALRIAIYPSQIFSCPCPPALRATVYPALIFSCPCVWYPSFGVAGFLSYGLETSPIITTNLPHGTGQKSIYWSYWHYIGNLRSLSLLGCV